MPPYSRCDIARRICKGRLLPVDPERGGGACCAKLVERLDHQNVILLFIFHIELPLLLVVAVGFDSPSGCWV